MATPCSKTSARELLRRGSPRAESQLCVITVLACDACTSTTDEVLGHRAVCLLPLKSGYTDPRCHICLEPPASLSLPLAWLLSVDFPGSPYKPRELSPHRLSSVGLGTTDLFWEREQHRLCTCSIIDHV